MTAFAAVLDQEDAAALPDRFASNLTFLGAPAIARSPDRRFGAAFVGCEARFDTAPNGVSVVVTGRLDRREALTAALGAAPSLGTAALLLRAYERWGASLLDHVIGDFGFALWDPVEGRLLAATDQFGIRPVYYAQAGGRLAIATAIGPLRDSGLVSAALDPAFIADFLVLGGSLDPAGTVHAAIRRLPPGHRLERTNSSTAIRPYWQAPDFSHPDLRPARGDYAEEFRSLFFEAVRDRIPAQAPMTIQLSGGMDSASVAAAIHGLIGPEPAHERLSAHTIVYQGYPELEGHFARLIVDHLGLQWRTWTAEEFIFGPIPDRSTRAGPQPDAVRELVPEDRIIQGSAAAGAAHFTGMGGDMLFYAQSAPLGGRAPPGGWRLAELMRHWTQFGRLPNFGLRSSLQRAHGRPPRLQPPAWLREELVRRSGLSERLTTLANEAPGPRALQGPIWSSIMAKGDAGSTGLDLQIVHPFVDVRLVEFALRLPGPMLRAKRVLREAMAALLPPAIIERPKTILGRAAEYAARHAALAERRMALIDRTPQLGEFVDVEALRRAAAAPRPEDTRGVALAEALAVWLLARETPAF
jgi:asparagine synthase (glutamine-hydrolysing)